MVQILEALPGFKFGCDPELFVLNDRGEYVTAEGLLPGTKEDPYKVECGAIQVDGMAAEFNIDPVTTFEDFSTNIHTVMKTLKKMLPAGYSLSAVPAVTFSEEEWSKTPDVAKILGCNPDFNAWDGRVNPPPNTDSTPRLRTASGHLHIGWTEDAEITDKDYVQNAIDLVKQLDWYLGAWSLQKDTDPVRRRLYGNAGAMRFKPYGVEYRVLSNFWVGNGRDRLLVWNRMVKAIENMRSGFMPEIAKAQFNDILIRSINNSTLDGTLKACFPEPLTKITF